MTNENQDALMTRIEESMSQMQITDITICGVTTERSNETGHTL